MDAKELLRSHQTTVDALYGRIERARGERRRERRSHLVHTILDELDHLGSELERARASMKTRTTIPA